LLPIKIKLPDGFLDEEVRCGHTVTEEMKKLWAVELDLLAEFDRVCKKYGLPYFADGGTLLGAIRHKGFIPWDDDIDVAMFRKDYEKLEKVADQEFQHPYFFQTPFNDPGLVAGGSRLRNSDTTLITDFDHHRPYENKGIFIDVVVLDVIPDNELQLRALKFALKYYWRILRYASYYEDYFKPGKKYTRRRVLAGKLALILKSVFGIKRLSAGYTWLCSLYSGKDTQQLEMLECTRGKFITPSKCYDCQKISYVPFESLQIPIPAGYDQILTIEYGDYMVMRKVLGLHMPLTFDTETPYSEYGRKDNKRGLSI